MSYTPPTPHEIRDILKELELTGGEAAKQAGLENSRAIRRMTSDGSTKIMPYSVLFTLMSKNRGMFVSVDGWKNELIEEGVLKAKIPDYMNQKA